MAAKRRIPEQQYRVNLLEKMPISHFRVVIVDDHAMVREGLAGILTRSGISVVGQGEDGKQALELYHSLRPDILLLDVRLPDQNGIDVLRTLRKTFPEAKVVMLTSSPADAMIYAALSSGASGFLLKGMNGAMLVQQLQQVMAGGSAVSGQALDRLTDYMSSRKLSEREIEVLQLVANGKSNKEIAQQLFLSADTVKVHLQRMMAKLQAADRTQAVVIAVQRGLLQL